MLDSNQIFCEIAASLKIQLHIRTFGAFVIPANHLIQNFLKKKRLPRGNLFLTSNCRETSLTF